MPMHTWRRTLPIRHRHDWGTGVTVQSGIDGLATKWGIDLSLQTTVQGAIDQLQGVIQADFTGVVEVKTALDLLWAQDLPSATLLFTDQDNNNSGLSVYTFVGVDIGAEAADRFVVICAGGRVGRVILTVTVAGVACTLVNQVLQGGNNQYSDIWLSSVPIPTGLTATVVLDFGSFSPNRLAMAAYRLTGSTGVPIDSGVTESNAAGDNTILLNVPERGAVLGYSYNSGASAYTWTGALEDFDNAPPGSGNWHSGASETVPVADAARAITNNPASSGARTDVACSFGPA